MKKRNSNKKLRKGVLCIVLLTTLFVLIKKYQESVIYDNLDVDISSKIFEYGNSINLKSFLNNNKDYKYSIVKDLNTYKVGKQKVVVKVEYKGVAKVVPIELNVVDTVAPVIEFKEDTITIDEGNSINLIDNISSVVDNDENIEYREESTIIDGLTNYYTVYSDGFDSSVPSEYSIRVVALDKVGNRAEKIFKVVVKEVVKVVPKVSDYWSDITTDASINVQGGDIVSLATSLVGSRYVYGGNSPQTGFDCSGFVQYVYSMTGKSISRSSSTQAYDGVGISYHDAMPGDIILWGHGGAVTHSSIYIGNGQIVHAINQNLGVIVSDVNTWTNSDVMMSVRRVA